MIFLRRIFHFLGGIYFAIFLIASSAIFVVFGTLIESITDSHKYAAYFTYQNPVFISLLWCFFINILISALRRWPFKKKHIPFLLTHWGLLMILAGALLKSSYGLQGTMSILEGGSSNELFLQDTYALRVDKKPEQGSSNMSTAYIPMLSSGSLESHDDIAMELLEYVPNSCERLETWIKRKWGYISGQPPFPVYDRCHSSSEDILVSAQMSLDQSQGYWDIYGLIVDDISAASRQIYEQNLEVVLTDTITQKLLFKGPLQNMILMPKGTLSSDVVFSFSPVLGFENPKIRFILNSDDYPSEIIEVPLQGKDSLKNLNISSPSFGSASVTIDLLQKPSLAFIKDPHGDTFLFAFDSYGRVYSQSFRNDNLESYIAYDYGFGGYAVSAKIPFKNSQSRGEIKEKSLEFLKAQLTESSQELSPPLRLLQSACNRAGLDFAETCVNFLEYWNNCNCWLYPENMPLLNSITAFQCLDFSELTNMERKACYWTHMLFSSLEPQLKHGDDLLAILKEKHWPLLKLLAPNGNRTLLDQLTIQMFLISDQLPNIPEDVVFTDVMKARLISAYFRASGIHLSTISLPSTFKEEWIELESPLTCAQTSEPSMNKLEDNLPKITLKLKKGEKVELLSLSYDRYGQGLKWPVFNGEYLIRFQPLYKKIPYRVRLRKAEQINYANTNQPYSFESDLLITDMVSQSTIEKKVSMNNVYETWEGYRFYLANIAPQSEIAAKRIQLVVNYDPAKYWFTYPGSIILTLGICLLFWRNGRLKE